MLPTEKECFILTTEPLATIRAKEVPLAFRGESGTHSRKPLRAVMHPSAVPGTLRSWALSLILVFLAYH